MGKIFSAKDVLEFAVQIEKNGKDFYAILAKNSKDQMAEMTFDFLAGEEEKHYVVFQGILDASVDYEPAEAYPGEYFSYMNTLAKEHVFTEQNQGQILAKKIKTDREAIEVGIDLEKESILFYEGMKTVVPDSDHKTIDVLINQEQDHLRKLSYLKTKLK